MADLVFKAAQEQSGSEKPKIKTEAKAAVTEKASASLSNWDAQIAPIIDQNPQLKQIFNYKDTKHIMRAVNGRYDNIMGQLKEDDPKAYESFKLFKSNSLAVANELKKFNTPAFNPKAFDQYAKDANAYFNKIVDTYDYDKGKKFAMNSEGHMMTREQYDKWDQTPKVSTSKYSTDAKVVYNNELFKNLVADYETPNVSSAYSKLKNIDKHYRDQGLSLIQPITNSWVSTSLQRIDLKRPKADEDNAALNLNEDILSHISKHKTILDPSLAKRDQGIANNILKQLSGKSRNEKLQLLKTYSDKITDMSSRMGYYGNAVIYNKYKTSVIGTTQDYYPNSNIKGKSRLDYFNQTQENGIIDRTINNYREFRGVDTKIRLKTLDMTQSKWKAVTDGLGIDLNKNQFDAAMNELIDENGNIASFDKWKKNLSVPASFNTNAKQMEGFVRNGRYVTPGNGASILDGIFEQNKNIHLTWKGGYNNLPGGRTTKEDANKDLIAVYNGLKKVYKKTFDDVKANQVYAATLLDAGFGNNRNQALEYRGVDLSADGNMRLKATTGPKQENVNKIFSLLFDSNGNVNEEDVTIFGNKQIKEGLNALQKKDLEGQRELNESTLKTFLSKNNENVTMSFFRNTNIAGQAAYQFYNPKTKESMMVYVPKSKIGKDGVQEDLYMKTGRDPLEFTFQAKGELVMPILNNDKGKPAYTSAKLVYDRENDSYVGQYSIYNADGKIVPQKYTIPYGSAISVNDAQKNFFQFLSTNKNEF
jgi:hypothetical protein